MMTRRSSPLRTLFAATCICAGVTVGADAWAASQSVRSEHPERSHGASNSMRSEGGKGAVRLPAIRRLGIEPVEHNAAEYRAFLSNERSQGAGLAMLPYTAEQLSERLAEISERAASESGRYFTVSLSSGKTGTATREIVGGDAAQMASARSRLRRDYDLDAWMSVRLTFSPDQVQLRLMLKGAEGDAGVAGRVLAREDVFLPADATEKHVHEGMLTAISRIGRTLGHDGKVTSLREDLVTLDFGSERGLAPGSRVELGLVVLSAFHPVSGEFLRRRNVATHVVEVVDAREGSSIARIVSRNPTVLREAATLFARGDDSTLPLLAWREEKRSKLAMQGGRPWENPREVVTNPLTGVEDEGFGHHSEIKKQGDARKQSKARADSGFLASLRGSDDEAQGVADGGAATAENPGNANGTRTPTDAAQEDPPEGESDWGDGNGSEGSDALDGRETHGGDRARTRGGSEFRLLGAYGGLGTTFGILSTDRGDRYTDLPSTVVNTILAGARLALPSRLESMPEIALRFYSGGDAEGNEVSIKAPVVTQIAKYSSGRFLAGGELHLSAGQVKTIRVKKDLGEFAILGIAELEHHVSGVGEATLGSGLSVFGLLGGHLEGYLRVGVTPAALLPRPLSVYARASSGPEKWSAFEVGVTWSFLSETP